MYSAQDTLDAIRKEKYKKTYPFIISQGYVITRYENNNNILLVTDVSCGFVYFVRPIQLLEIEHQMASDAIGYKLSAFCEAMCCNNEQILKYRGDLIKDIAQMLNQKYSNEKVMSEEFISMCEPEQNDEKCQQDRECCTTIPEKSLQDIQQSFDNQIKIKMIPTVELSIDNRNKLIRILSHHYDACNSNTAWSDDCLIDYVETLVKDAFNKGLQYQRDANCAR